MVVAAEAQGPGQGRAGGVPSDVVGGIAEAAVSGSAVTAGQEG